MKFSELKLGSIFRFEFEKNSQWLYQKTGDNTCMELRDNHGRLGSHEIQVILSVQNDDVIHFPCATKRSKLSKVAYETMSRMP